MVSSLGVHHHHPINDMLNNIMHCSATAVDSGSWNPGWHVAGAVWVSSRVSRKNMQRFELKLAGFEMKLTLSSRYSYTMGAERRTNLIASQLNIPSPTHHDCVVRSQHVGDTPQLRRHGSCTQPTISHATIWCPIDTLTWR